MAQVRVPQGVLNRLRSSAVFAAFPGLNVTAPYLTKPGLRLSFIGASTVLIDSMTGVVTSPEPYLQFLLEMHLNKAQAFADVWKKQNETNTILGDVTVRGDAFTLSPYQLSSASILGIDGLDFSGGSAEFTVRVGGTYLINSSLWP